MSEPLLLVHGGAGEVPPAVLPEHRDGCLVAARAGGAVLAAGGSAAEAACTAVEILEDNPLYNAGTGCALDANGHVCLDAGVMTSHDEGAGGVAALPAFRNPIRIAQRLLAVRTILLGSEFAAQWAVDQGFERLADEDLIVERSRRAWERVVQGGEASNWAGGTVGAVARDAQGHMAAATSTGGIMGKLPGRIGDSPLLGAGTLADPRCAISATGDGESFMRLVFAGRLAADIQAGADPAKALQARLEQLTVDYDGSGGAILITPESGPLAFRTTKTMSHAWWTPSGDGADV